MTADTGKIKVLWCLLIIVTSSNCLDFCDKKWTKILETSGSGVAVFGSKQDLVESLKRGADVKIYSSSWGGNGYASITNNAYFKNGEVCAQALMHVSKAGWDSFQSNVYWWFLNLCTTGHVHMARYYVGSNTRPSTSDTKTTAQITWFVRELGTCGSRNPEPVLCHTRKGYHSCGDLATLSEAVRKGSDIRLISKQNCQVGYSTPFSNIDTSGNLVAGQALWHLSQTFVGNHLEFQNNAYWWFTMWSSDGTRDMSRWTLGAHVDRSHTSDKVGADWFVDACWSLAYKHDEEGNAVEGSLDFLRSAARNGHRVKLVMGTYSIEADNVQIKDGHVSAQLLGHVSKQNTQRFQDNVYWFWQHISTTGSSDIVRYNVGDTTNRGNTIKNYTASWFIDNRAWKHVLSTSGSGSATFGSKSDLITAVRTGSSIRYTVHLNGETLILPADNIGISNDGNNLAVQTIKTVSYTNHAVRAFQSNPHWRFIIATTTGKFKESKWRVGSHSSINSTPQNVNIDWYVD